MSTENTTESTTAAPFIPTDDTPVEGGGERSYRFANGKIVRGRQKTVEVDLPSGGTKKVETGDYDEELKHVTGALTRVWIADYTDPKWGKVHRLEADVLTQSGVVHLAANLLDKDGNLKPSVSALNFAWCLLQYGKDAPCRLETQLGQKVVLKDGSEGAPSTYVNCFSYVDGKFKPIYREKRAEGAVKQTTAEQWNELAPKLKAHPAWKAREIRSAPTHFSELNKEMIAKGFPSPEQAPEEWALMVGNALQIPPKAHLNEYTDDQWGQIRQAMQSKTECPKALIAKQAELAAARSSALD